MRQGNVNRYVTGHVVSQKVRDNVPNMERLEILNCIPPGFKVFIDDEIDGVIPNAALIGKDERGPWCITKLITEREARDAKGAQGEMMYEGTVAVKKTVSVSAESEEKASEYAVDTMRRKHFDVNEYGGIDQIAVLSVEEWGKK